MSELPSSSKFLQENISHSRNIRSILFNMIRHTCWAYVILLIYSMLYIRFVYIFFHLIAIDIYDSWLAEYFESTMYTETWQNGRGKTPSNCSAQYKVTLRYFVNLEFKEIKTGSARIK